MPTESFLEVDYVHIAKGQLSWPTVSAQIIHGEFPVYYASTATFQNY